MLTRSLIPALVCLAATLSVAEPPARSIDPEADAALHRMSDCLAAAPSFAYRVHATGEEVTVSGQSIQFARNTNVLIRRPDRAAVTVSGDREEYEFYYDGARTVLYNVGGNVYASVPVASTLDETCDLLATKYGMSLPLADLVFANPYKVLTENIRSAHYVGRGYVFATRCHHIACVQDNVDWEIWIDADADHPLPLKVAITYKLLPGQPRYTAFLSNWDLAAPAPDIRFAFTAPPEAREVPWLAPTTRPATQPSQPDPAR